MRLGVSSFVITYTLCILLGVTKAVRNGTVFDTATSVLVLVGYGIPGFVLAVFLIKAFGPSADSWVSLIPLRGIQSPPEIYNTLTPMGKFWDNVHHMIAPVICLTISSFAGLTMLTKNSVLEQFHQLYAVAARARGLSQRKVLLKHVLRNSLIPLVTGFPARFVMMFFAGSLLIEKIFSLDGLGLLSFTALVERDYPLIISNMFIFTFIGLTCRLLSDIGYVIVDPRISFEGKKS
ncbi:MAG: ABC transporter permease subunit [Kiritimatiellia bacterium]|nr:ABC transporter permease subunit [Kiritimatiellia bacterium]MDP6630757.1 ABC transporter permease subunit [Kiritimatiellia bacterium]MDP6809380.1 ABC transporter permease subunit [Kiritimatiellia bacterium]MDP7023943.1 ABC transporter permease subunit [Kiritimatiellia bacterium]